MVTVNLRSFDIAERLAASSVALALVSMAASCAPESTAAPRHADHTLDQLQQATWRGPDGQEWNLTVWGSKAASDDWALEPQAAVLDVDAKNTDHVSNRDWNEGGHPDRFIANSAVHRVVIWDGASIETPERLEGDAVTDDRDGDGVMEVWLKRTNASAMLYSASGKVRFDKQR